MIAIVHLHRHDNGAGIDLIGLLHVLELAVLFQLSHRHQRKIHQADKLVLSACKYFLSGVQIALIGRLDRGTVIAFAEFHIRQFG